MKILKITEIILTINFIITIVALFMSGYGKDYFRNKAGECSSEMAEKMMRYMRLCEQISVISSVMLYIAIISFILLFIFLIIRCTNKT